MLAKYLFKAGIKQGNLVMIDAHGKEHRFGDGTGEPVIFRLHNPKLHTSIGLNPQLKIGEAYMDGTLTVENTDLLTLLDLFTLNTGRTMGPGIQEAINWGRIARRRFDQLNPASRSKKNVSHHYDLSAELYDLFLDKDRQYSCGYYRTPDMGLEDAQLAKKEHLASKLRLEDGQKLLDIGSGWGGLSLYLSKQAQLDITGITLSDEQFSLSNERARKEKLDDRVRFKMTDYRDMTGPFDRIVSVGMFEHVGINHYRSYFKKINALLTEDGVAVIHTIARTEGSGATNPWIRKYIFPGGYIPALSEIVPAIERSGLLMTDIEVLRLHYMHTCKDWLDRFMANWDKVAKIYDERFCRMWEFYLAGAVVSFKHLGHVVVQIQLVRDQNVLPLTRDYMQEEERALMAMPRHIQTKAG